MNVTVSFSIFSFALIAFGTFFVGRDKVNCPAGQEMVLWRTTSARRINRLHTVTNGAPYGKGYPNIVLTIFLSQHAGV